MNVNQGESREETMTADIGPRRSPYGRPLRFLRAVLVVLVVLLVMQGEVTVRTVLVGLLGGVLLATLWPPKASMPGDFTLRPLAALRFALVFLYQLVVANAVVAWEVLTPTDSTRPGIIAVGLGDAPDGLTALVVAAVNLTPGTFVVETRHDPTVLYVHVLHLHSVEEARAGVRSMHHLAARAFRRSTPVMPDEEARP